MQRALQHALGSPTPPTQEHTSCATSLHANHLGVCRCDCVVVDIGLNDGASLQQWPRDALAQAKKDGISHRPVWQRLQQCLSPSAATCYYGFEANPDLSAQLEALGVRLRADGVRVKLFTETAFSTHGSGEDFFVEPKKFGTGQVASSLVPRNNLVRRLKGKNCSTATQGVHCGKWVTEKGTTVASFYRKRRVASVDGAEFLRAVRRWSDFVAVKLDVESFEFRLLPHLLLGRPRSLCGGVDLLAVEWHEWLNPEYQNRAEPLSWLMRQPECNVTVASWI